MSKKQAGIYQIRNLVNGKIYIGSSVNISHRWSQHRCGLQKNCHHNKHLQNSWNTHGIKNFIFEIIEKLEYDDNLIMIEQMYLDSLKPEYNIAKIANAPTKGISLPEEVKQKISKSQSGERAHMWGKHHSEETKRKMSKSRSGDNHPFWGKTFSDEYKAKLSFAQQGEKGNNVIMTEAGVLKMRKLWRTGKYKQKELAEMWGVSKSAVNGIVNYYNWKHIK
jgi:group I intron endonuclease